MAPLLLAIVLGDRMEVGLRRALTISNGDYATFFQGAAARVFIAALVLIIVLQGAAWLLGYRKRLATSSDGQG